MPITGVPATIAAIYTTAAGQSIATATTTIIDFGAKGWDTHNAVTTGAAWAFTAPASGFYRVSSAIVYTGTATWADAEFGNLAVYVNGVYTRALARKDNYGSASTVMMNLGGSATLYLNTGDTVDIRTRQTSGAALALHNESASNYVSIVKV